MEKIIFGGAVFSMLIVTLTFIISLCLFMWKWFLDDFKRGYKDAMESK
tara:strand:+ start:524 stop:667 length:144 start_codon:yes stop_codon:yes gene_type:complete